MKKITIIIICALLVQCMSASGQNLLSHALSKLDYTSLPFKPDKNTVYGNAYIQEEGQAKGMLYTNLLCTEYYYADSYDTEPLARNKFKVPNNSLAMVLVQYGGITEFMTRTLFLTDNSGRVLDKLDVEINNIDFPVRQYEITAGGEIIVYRIIPEDDKLKFEDLFKVESFTGNRRDETYVVKDGKFVLKNAVDYVTTTYYSRTLEDDYSIWHGHERTTISKVLGKTAIRNWRSNFH